MEDSKSKDCQDESPNKEINKETIEQNKQEQKSTCNNANELNESKDSKINLNQKIIDKENNEKLLGDNKNLELTSKINISKNENNDIKKDSRDKTIGDNYTQTETNLNKSDNNDKENDEKALGDNKKLENNKKVELTDKSNLDVDKTKINPKKIATTIPVNAKKKPVKEPPIEKKPFLEFVNDYLIPEIKKEFELKGKEVNKIILQKTYRPIAEDICWVIYCEINDTCNFWLSFEKDDITSLKSFSLCKNYEKPSIIESFLIDEKKITLKLIISRILQRLNGQKLIGAN